MFHNLLAYVVFTGRVLRSCAGCKYGRVFILTWWLCAGLTGCSPEASDTIVPVQSAPSDQTLQGTIVALGDSLTAGLGVDEDQAYPAQLERKLRDDGYALKVINAGVSGETSSGTRSRIQWVVSSLNPDIVILETGANDGLRGIDPKLLEKNLDALAAFLKEKKIVVVLAGMQMLPNLGPEYVKAFSRVYPQIALEYNLILVPFFLNDVAGNPAYNQADKIHPTVQGYTRVVEHIYPFVLKGIERYLNKKSAPGAQTPVIKPVIEVYPAASCRESSQ